MLTPKRRSFAIGQVVAVIVAGLLLTTPASAQFGGLKKKLKGEAAQKGVEKAAGAADAPAAPGDPAGGTLVLTPEVVDRLIAGLKAGKAERDAAKTKDTPYGRYLRDSVAYHAAKAKCDTAQQTYPTRLAADEKMMAKSQKFIEKMMDAQTRQDTSAGRAYSDSSLAIVDPSCTVKQPQRPNDYWDAQRAIDSAAEQATLKVGDFTATEFGQASDRAIAILTGTTPPGDASPSEKAAVNSKGTELKPLLGIRDAQAARVSKAPAPAPTPAPAPAPAPSQPTAEQARAVGMQECMNQNVLKHEAEIRALGERGQAAHKAGNTAAMMAIADTLNRLQMGDCMGPR